MQRVANRQGQPHAATAVVLNVEHHLIALWVLGGHRERLTARRSLLGVEHAMGFGFTGVDLGSVRVVAEDIQQGGQARASVHVKSMLNG
jgi:hypothetical protein